MKNFNSIYYIIFIVYLITRTMIMNEYNKIYISSAFLVFTLMIILIQTIKKPKNNSK